MARTHKSLEGKEIIYEGGTYGFRVKAIVTGCNRHIGLSVQLKKDMSKYLVCLNGPGSPLYTGNSQYMECFEAAVRGIDKGIIRVSDFYHLQHGFSPSSDNCPYSQ